MVGGLVVGAVTFQGAYNLVIDRPVDVVGLPVDFVRVPVLTSVRDVVDVVAVAICLSVSIQSFLGPRHRVTYSQ